MNLKKKNKELVPVEEGKFIGNMIFHVDSDAFEENDKMQTVNDLETYQGMLKWNFANMIDKELINLSLAFAEMVEYTGRSKSEMFGSVSINPYEVINNLKFLRNTDWWMECFKYLERDDHGYIKDHPFIHMTAANIFGELTNRVFANIGMYYTDIDVAAVVQYVINENYENMLRMIKNIFQMALDCIKIWGDALMNIEANSIPVESDEFEKVCSCKGSCNCHFEE